MTMYTKRHYTHLTVATDYVVSICCCSRRKDAKVGHSTGKRHTFKCGSVMSSAEVIALTRRNIDHGVTRDIVPCHWQMEIFIRLLMAGYKM
jgi:hypothetical protein